MVEASRNGNDPTRQADNPLDEPPWSPELIEAIAERQEVWLCHDQADADLLLRPDAGDLPALCVPLQQISLLTADLVKPVTAVFVIQGSDAVLGDGFYARYALQVKEQLAAVGWRGPVRRLLLNEITPSLARLWERVIEDRERFRAELNNFLMGSDDEEVTPRRPASEPASSRWQVFSLADAYRPRDPPVEIVAGLFELPSLSVVYGAPGTLKSLWLLDLLLCIAAGRPWLAPLSAGEGAARAVRQAPALWVDFDNGRRLTEDRVAAVGRAYGLPPETLFYYVSMPSPWLDGSTVGGLDPLRAAIERYEAKAVVIDNLLMMKGAVDENSAGMGQVMAHLRQVVEAYDALLLPIHHQRKESGTGGRTGDRLRGHSSIEAALDLALLVEREEGSDAITVRSTKTRDATVTPFGAMFAYEHEAGSRRLHLARFYGLPIADESSDRAIEQTIREILQAEGESLKTALSHRVHALLSGVGVNRIRRVIDRMLRQGHLRMAPGIGREERIGLPWRRG